MPTKQRIVVQLAPEMVELVRRKVSSGQYADESEVIADSLTFLEDEEQYFERWLREEVIPACREYDEDPSQGRTLAEARAELEAARRQNASASTDDV